MRCRQNNKVDQTSYIRVKLSAKNKFASSLTFD